MTYAVYETNPKNRAIAKGCSEYEAERFKAALEEDNPKNTYEILAESHKLL